MSKYSRQRLIRPSSTSKTPQIGNDIVSPLTEKWSVRSCMTVLPADNC